MWRVAENFKKWLLAQIQANNWTYESLGNLIGVSHGAIGGWVRGNTHSPCDSRLLEF
jgi:transcriptional regulator with XRE-family HTH domain